MINKNIIDSFDFLINDYNCSVSFESDYGDSYEFYSRKFKLKIYVWEQFDELDINIIYNMENFHINPFIEEPHKISIINSKRKGIKGFFYNYDREFWKIVADIVRNKIMNLVNNSNKGSI